MLVHKLTAVKVGGMVIVAPESVSVKEEPTSRRVESPHPGTDNLR